MKTVTITMPEPLAKAFLKLAEGIDQEYSNAGCNDFVMPNTPENRELYNEVNHRRSIEDGTAEDSSIPKKGALPFYDNELFSYFVDCVRSSVK
jgi:hypothetical protein